MPQLGIGSLVWSACRIPWKLSLELPHELPLRQDVPPHGIHQLGPGRTGEQVQKYIQGVELEEVAVWLALRRGGAAVANLAEVILPLPRREAARWP